MQERIEGMLEGIQQGSSQQILGIRVHRMDEDLFVIAGVPMGMATAALAAVIRDTEYLVEWRCEGTDATWYARSAEHVVAHADALIAELDKEPSR